MPHREIVRAWEAFHQDGIASPVVRPAVLASWQRSRAHAIAADRSAAPLMSEAELHRRRQHNSGLVTAARPAMDEARNLLSDASSMVILTDTDGAILETEGDMRAVGVGQEVRLQRGGLWCEAKIGTNAIGTALASARPVQIHAAEHFCAPVHRWTCAAAPVRHPLDGNVIGAVDISGSTDTFNPQNLAHAVALAHQIEAVLGRRLEMEHEQVLRHFLSKRSLWVTEEIIAFGRSGALIYSTERALKEVATRSEGFIASGRLAALKDASPDAWARLIASVLPGASVEVVREDGQEIGGVVVLHAPGRRARPAPREPGREAAPFPFEAILGESAVMGQVRERARRMAESGAAILLEGETGVGKELFARAIHGARNPQGPFVPVNCGGLPRDLIASEIFGYEKGSFTGADAAGRPGKVEAADGGVLCLDEIGEMPLDLQSYLLRVLEDGTVYRIGSHVGRRVDLRLVSMTNRDLAGEVAAGTFRRDLFYRISSLRLRIPPLRERGDDVLLLAQSFLTRFAIEERRDFTGFSDEAAARLGGHAWPGNVRELQNAVRRMVVLNHGTEITAAMLPATLKAGTVALSPDAASPPAAITPFWEQERSIIENAVGAFSGNIARAAAALEISPSTIYRKRQAWLERRSA